MNNADEIKFLRAEVDRLTSENENLKVENDRLQKEYQKIKIDLMESVAALKKMDYQTQKLSEKNLEHLAEKEKINKLETEVMSQKDLLYKIAHSINNDLYNAGNLLNKTDENTQIRNASHHIKRIGDLMNLYLWLLKKSELEEKWSSLDLVLEIEDLIRSTKDGILTLMTSELHSTKLIGLDVNLSKNGSALMEIGNEKLDIVVSLILQDLIRNSFKYSDEKNPIVRIEIRGDDEDFIVINFVNNKLMNEKYIRYLNHRDEEPEISDSSKVGLRSILEWIDVLVGCKIDALNLAEKNEFQIILTLPRILVV